MSAIQSTRLSSVLGYELLKGTDGVTSGFLPQRLAILAEANTDKQSTVSETLDATSTSEIAAAYGNGSPAHLAALNLDTNGVLGKIPTVFYYVGEAAGAVAQVYTVAVAGAATKSATQYIRVGGKRISFSVASGDESAAVLSAIDSAISAYYNSPVSSIGGVLTAKWKGQTSADIDITFDQDTDIGLTYTASDTAAGAGETLPATALALFGEAWNTIVINCLGVTSTILDDYETFVGNVTDKTGRYDSEDWKPCVVVSGTAIASKTSLVAITDNRKAEEANSVIPFGNSLSMPCEMAAGSGGRYALLANSDPKADMINTAIKGIVPPIDGQIGDLSAYDNRDYVAKLGCSTTKLSSGEYQIVDLITTYHPDGESPAQFRYVRNLVGIDFNVKFAVRFNEELFMVGKTILPDANGSTASGVIKPKQWKGILNDNVFKVFAEAGLFSDADYSFDSCIVEIDSTNPDRLNTEFPYKRTGTARISSVSGIANFQF